MSYPGSLQRSVSGGGTVEEISPGRWRLALPPGEAGQYRLAQLDDYRLVARRDFPWQISARVNIRMRVSDVMIPGTWGVGLWNDPFVMSMGLGGMARRLPVIPNTAWFFFASPPNYLALRDDHPVQGLLAATFSSPRIPSWMLAPAGLVLPLFFLKPAARILRRTARLLLCEDAFQVEVDPMEWHVYAIEWTAERVSFRVDEKVCFETGTSPVGPLGLVIWVDNQFLNFPPNERLRAGTLASTRGHWLEIEALTVV
ncbi:MAG: family 16 glycosylhydrolase [Anaerolineaceae bacterium]|nr:family 16 glycosylhydrolase [Anaerolineaceae bacterium]